MAPGGIVTDNQQTSNNQWAGLISSGFGKSFWVFVALALLSAGICYAILGPAAFHSAIDRDHELLSTLLPRVAAAQIVAGMVWVLLPRDRLSRFLKRYSGRRGLVIATVAGIVTPGGPASAFPFLAILASGGADRGILVSYITSWALLGVQRIIVWDIPLMGMDFSLLRLAISLPLPIIAGMIARQLPYTGLPEVVPSTGSADK